MLDGSKDAEIKLKSMLFWDVNNGISRKIGLEIRKQNLP